MPTPIPDTPGQIGLIPVSRGLYNQRDKLESSLSDDEAIITLAQGTENGNSEAIADALSDDDEEEGEGGVIPLRSIIMVYIRSTCTTR